MIRIFSVALFSSCLFLVSTHKNSAVNDSYVNEPVNNYDHIQFWPKKKKPVKEDETKGKGKGGKPPAPKPKPDRYPEHLWGHVGKDLIFDLSGERPSDASVRKTIKETINYIIGEQKSDGSWDVELQGKSALGKIADEAVDAVAITAMCGLGLRRHVALDERIPARTKRAAQFIMTRIFRGRLSNSVQYAVWRYTLGLKFITEEYKAMTKERGKARRRKWYGSVQLQIFKGIVPCLIRFTKILEK